MSVISGFYAESSAVVQGKSCVVRAVSHGSDIDRSGGSCGKETSPAHHARSQRGVTRSSHMLAIRELILLCKLWSLVFLHVWWNLWKRHVSCTSRKISTWCEHAMRTCWLSRS